jgi:hypothetical protein
MPDTKVSALAAAGALDTADLLPVVDVSDTSMSPTGTDKKLTVNQLIGGATTGQLVYCTSVGVPAGTATILVGANNQLNLAEIATPGTLVSGDRWNDSTQHCGVSYDGSATNASCLKVFRGGTIYQQVANATATAIGADSLISTGGAVGTNSLPAGFLNVQGRTLRLTASGYGTTSGGPGSITFSVKLGGNTIATSPTIAMTAGKSLVPFSIKIDIACKTVGASGTVDSLGSVLSAAPGGTTMFNTLGICNGTTPGTQTPTTPVVVDLTAAYVFDLIFTLTVATNSFVITNLTLEVLG